MNHLCLISGILAWGLCLHAAEPAVTDDISAAKLEEQIQKLRAAELADRKKACESLAEWAAKEPEQAKKRFLTLLRESEDPEIRERSLQLLKPIAALEFGRFGEGYLGITMGNEVLVKLPNEDKPCYGLMVNVVTKDSPAEKAKVQVGDLIVGANGQRWWESQKIIDEKTGLSATIRAAGAGNRTRFLIWRDNSLHEHDAILTRRPGNLELMQMQLMANGGVKIDEDELQKMVEEEKNSAAYFSEWLNRQFPSAPQNK